MANMFEEKKFQLELLRDTNLLLIIEKGTSDGICHACTVTQKLMINTRKTIIQV